MTTNRARFETIKTLAAGGIGAAYATVGTAFSAPIRAFRISNDTDGDCMFSIDGVNDHMFVAADSFILYDVAGNSSTLNDYRLPQGTQFYVKEIVSPTTGDVYIEGLITEAF